MDRPESLKRQQSSLSWHSISTEEWKQNIKDCYKGQYVNDFLYLMNNFINSLYCDVAAESQNNEVREDGHC